MAIVVVCQFALAIYLPSVGAIRAWFSAEAGATQALLSVYLIVFAVTQLAVGPLADRYGRRRILIVGLALFGAASLLCATAPSFAVLLLGRAVQAVGACAGVMLTRAMVRDVFSGPAAMRAMSLISAAGALAPALSPLAGGQLQLLFGWWASFAATGLAALALVALSWRLLPETGQAGGHVESLAGLWRGYAMVLRRRRFLGFTLNGTCATGAFYVFLAGAPELLIERRGVPLEMFGWFTFAWAGSFVVGSLSSGRLAQRHGPARMVPLGVALLTVGGLAMAATGLAGSTALGAIVLPLMLMGFGNGFTMPSSLAGAMAAVPASVAGTASAAIGVAQVGGGALISFLSGLVPHTDQTPIGLGIALIGTVSALSFLLLSRK